MGGSSSTLCCAVIPEGVKFADVTTWEGVTVIEGIKTQEECKEQKGTTKFFEECPSGEDAEKVFKEWKEEHAAGEVTVAPTVAPSPNGDATKAPTTDPTNPDDLPGGNAAAMGLTLAGVLFILQL